jgi:uncharacterized protein
MNKEIKVMARKQYFHYFRVWFIVIGILFAVFAVVWVMNMLQRGDGGRGNQEAPAERVYDYADVLTDEEEQKLREHIAVKEAQYQVDLVLVTINEDVESQGYWDTVMMNKADDFYDQHKFGYDTEWGDGAELLDNWYEDSNGSQAGSWLSTCGKVYTLFGDDDIDYVLDGVYRKVDSDPYGAYKIYVDRTCQLLGNGGVGTVSTGIPFLFILVGPALIALIYALVNLKQSPAKVTVTKSAYVEGGRPVMNFRSDDFLRKNVVSRRIETSSSGSRGYRSGGGGGHRSSSGVRHGGGGRRR